jgi:Leucine-rich repeat (LRR) protein
MLNNLNMLNLTNCGIKTLSDDIANLSRLTILDLKGNKLVDPLPIGIQQLTNLGVLDISNNTLINSLDALNSSTSLNYLNASGCELNHLPLFLYSLSILDMSDNKLTSLIGIETNSMLHMSSFKNNQI